MDRTSIISYELGSGLDAAQINQQQVASPFVIISARLWFVISPELKSRNGLRRMQLWMPAPVLVAAATTCRHQRRMCSGLLLHQPAELWFLHCWHGPFLVLLAFDCS